MARPLMQKGIAELEAMFGATPSDARVLKQLEAELRHRQVPRAVTLLEKVQRALPAAAAPATRAVEPPRQPVAAKVAPQPELWPVGEPVAQTSEPPVREVQLPPESGAKPSVAPLPSLSVEAACQVLKVPPTAPWEAIELARRQLVDLAHPRRVAALAADKRAAAQETARQANAAYTALHHARTTVSKTLAAATEAKASVQGELATLTERANGLAASLADDRQQHSASRQSLEALRTQLNSASSDETGS